MVPDKFGDRHPDRTVSKYDFLQGRASKRSIHRRCQRQVQKPVVELLDRGQVDQVQHGEGSRKEVEGSSEHRIRRALHVQINRR